jgi:hypothetical protein
VGIFSQSWSILWIICSNKGITSLFIVYYYIFVMKCVIMIQILVLTQNTNYHVFPLYLSLPMMQPLLVCNDSVKFSSASYVYLMDECFDLAALNGLSNCLNFLYFTTPEVCWLGTMCLCAFPPYPTPKSYKSTTIPYDAFESYNDLNNILVVTFCRLWYRGLWDVCF